jgi:hypothetical protein
MGPGFESQRDHQKEEASHREASSFSFWPTFSPHNTILAIILWRLKRSVPLNHGNGDWNPIAIGIHARKSKLEGRRFRLMES